MLAYRPSGKGSARARGQMKGLAQGKLRMEGKMNGLAQGNMSKMTMEGKMKRTMMGASRAQGINPTTPWTARFVGGWKVVSMAEEC